MKKRKEAQDNLKIPLEKLAPPGISGELIILDRKANEKRSDQEIFKELKNRNFLVKAQLSKTIVSNDGELKASFDEKSGDSFLTITSGAICGNVQTKDGGFTLVPNDKGELSCFIFKCVAKSFQEAKHKFHQTVLPFIDFLSYKANCPIHLPLISSECITDNYELRTINYTTPYPKSTINPHENAIFNEMIPLYALYREAKNTDSNYYKLICFYKVLEGMYNCLRPELFKLAVKKGIPITRKRELVPNHPELKSNYIGKPIKQIFDKDIRNKYRNAIAHFVLNDGSVINVSDFYTNSDYSNMILLMELCCRVVMEIQEDYYKQVHNQ
jgi:hypothetical protein